VGPGRGAELPGGIGVSLPIDPAWCLEAVTGTAPGAVESQLCLSDGTVGSRAVLEEEHDPEVPPVLVAGVYEPADTVGEQVMTAASWAALPLAEGIPVGRRVLDLRDGLLTREAGSSRGTFRSARFACHGRPGTQVLVAEVPVDLVDGQDPDGTRRTTTDRRTSALGGGMAVAASTVGRPGDGPPGSVVTVDRIAAFVTSARRAPGTAEATRRLEESTRVGTAGLLDEQRAFWRERWAVADVEVVGDIEATRTLRACLFHLTGSTRRRGEAAVGARGLTGPSYGGHVFWDTEAFVLPTLASVDPAAARATLEYRLRRLDPARRRAAAEGRSGARFPWESALTGEEVTPTWGIDQHGEVIPITTGEKECHITAVVAWAAWKYASWHGGWRFLEGPGRPLVVETARYWATRVRTDGDGRGHIDGVIGPDEYHDSVDDNTFTNLMARWNLHRAAELVERTGGDPDEAADWRRTADALVDNLDPASGRYEQFAGYDTLTPLLITDVGPPPVPADIVLGHERIRTTQVIKQADVLMAHHLIPDGVAPGSLTANLDHYLPRTAHGSSLSPGVHAALLARAGRPVEALDLFRTAAAIDFDDLSGNEDGGLHMANLGAIWQAAVRGFAGLSVSSPGDPYLAVAPCLPPTWDELRIRVRWRGTPLRLACRGDRVHLESDRPMTVLLYGDPVRVGPAGRWVG
jgi:trehalose/maltose hydrolase-like predicted phosphorylase